MKRIALAPIFVVVATLVAACAQARVPPAERPTALVSWVPHWSSDHGYVQQSRMDLVQGLPGYSLIAGKDTLVAFTPYPRGMRTDKDSSRLDVYRVDASGNRAESPQVSGLRGVPVGGKKECDYWSNGCAEVNFLIPGEFTRSAGDYLFAVSWYHPSFGSATDSLLAEFHEPAVAKILFVPFSKDIFNTPDLTDLAMKSINHYVSRMPFGSDALDEIGPTAKYMDTYPEVLPWGEGWIRDGWINLYDPTIWSQISSVLWQKREDYNAHAPVKADYAVGVYHCPGVWRPADGRANLGSTTALCCISYVGNCTHEIGHLLWPTAEEGMDDYAPVNTCGYLEKESDASIDCQDWAYGTDEQAIHDPATPPLNVMSWDGASRGARSYYTRYFYESACMNEDGGCRSAQKGSVFGLRALDGDQYLDANMRTGEISLLHSVNPGDSLWTVEMLRREGEHRTYVTLHATDAPESGNICSDCPFSMLIGNPSTGEIATTDPAYYLHPDNRERFRGWCHEWEIKQLAADIVTLRCNARMTSTRFLRWEASQSRPLLAEPGIDHEEHFLPSFQWRVVVRRQHSP